MVRHALGRTTVRLVGLTHLWVVHETHELLRTEGPARVGLPGPGLLVCELVGLVLTSLDLARCGREPRRPDAQHTLEIDTGRVRLDDESLEARGQARGLGARAAIRADVKGVVRIAGTDSATAGRRPVVGDDHRTVVGGVAVLARLVKEPCPPQPRWRAPRSKPPSRCGTV